MQYPRSGGRDIPALKTTDGTEIKVKRPGTAGTGAGAGVTLVNGVTYVFMLNSQSAPLEHIHIKGDAAIIVTSATLESCSLPKEGDGAGAVDVSDWDLTAGNWVPEDPASAVAEVVGTGWTQAAGVVAAAGTGAGGASLNIGNLGAARLRLKVVVGAAGGLLRVCGHGKA